MVLLAARNALLKAGRVNARQFSSLPPPVLKTTTLSNQMRVVSVERETPTTHIGLYVHGGPRCEHHSFSGVSHFLRRAAFKATELRTAVTYCRQIESVAEDYKVSTGRDHLSFCAEINDGDVPSFLALLGDAMKPRLFYEYEGEEIRSLVKEDIEHQTYGDVVQDTIHRAAYRNGPLSSSPNCPSWNVDNIILNNMNTFSTLQYLGRNIVLVCVGPVSHERLIVTSKLTFGDVKADLDGKVLPLTPSNYNGGEVLHRCSGPTTLILALNGPSSGCSNWAAAQVAAGALGYHSSLFSHGLGSGQRGLLVQNVFAQNESVQSVNPYLKSYKDGGLFGVEIVYDTEHEKYSGDVARSAAAQLGVLSNPLSDEQLERAKSMAKAQLTSLTDRNSTYAHFLGTSVMHGAAPLLGADLGAAIDKVTSADVVAAIQKMKASPLSVACVGNPDMLLPYLELAKIAGTRVL